MSGAKDPVSEEVVVTTKTKSRAVSKTGAIMIDEAAALAATGENRLESVRQLIMRGMNLTSFERSCAARLRSLTVSECDRSITPRVDISYSSTGSTTTWYTTSKVFPCVCGHALCIHSYIDRCVCGRRFKGAQSKKHDDEEDGKAAAQLHI